MRRRRWIAALAALVLVFCLCGNSAAEITPCTICGTHGTAKHLAGRTVVVSVFASDTGTHWDFSRDKDVERYSICYHDLRMACEWLTEKAASYGVKTEFVWDWLAHFDLYYEHRFDRNMVVYPSDYSVYWEYINSSIPTDELLCRYDADNILYIFHYRTPKKNDVGSHAFPFGELDDDVCGFECVAMFSGLFTDVATPGTYAHEMLHLFGVPDMYTENKPYQMSKDFIKWYQKHYPWDIMAGAHTGDYSRMKYSFSDIVAYYAGLCDRPADADRWGLRRNDFELYGP
ncbi:MAG: hypothetical protein IKM82_02725 [Oscillospiraceae bacterium]|nr:hypothetical protein [Oscillospiraceae bacterium]MBR6839488.1 hypothetical protein [Oscillospiraceae bacterium]